ncbi:class I SAM-dependent methyltransferase [Roseibium sp. SCP14]|uniref:class I SAM-dependent methyltransferase n=1 Tax=Roseibium sp. SCP14 TaxID=3141375 RepID=UPI00333BE3F4
MTSYDSKFYDRIGEGSVTSAEAVIPVILEFVEPESVVDLGCGTGAWLRTLQRLGSCKEILGIESGQVDPTQLLIPVENTCSVDVSKPFDVGRRFDVAMTLEVAEHLPPEAAKTFVENLTRLSDVVIFSAAIPGQKGRNHVNMQYPSYWQKLFNEFGYELADVLRSKIWSNEEVKFWYRQNILFFCNRSGLDKFPKLSSAAATHSNLAIDIVHPEMLKKVIDENKERLAEVHTTYKARISDAKKDIWERARKKFGSAQD